MPLTLRHTCSMKAKTHYTLRKGAILLKKVRFIILFNIFTLVGAGATSSVFKATYNNDVNSLTALKYITNIFEHTVFAQRAVREMKILRCLNGHDNVRISNNFVFILSC
jgi:hypothetical protein